MAEICDKYFARAVDKRSSCQYNQELQVTASPEKERKYAVFYNVNAHQDPDHLDVPPAPVRRLKLPNSWKHDNWSADEFGSCPAGPGRKVHGGLSTRFFKSSLISMRIGDIR